MAFDPILYGEKYRIPTNRLQSEGYDVGFYHVVVCTQNKKCYLGHIDHEQMFYSVMGQFAKECIEGLSKYYPYAEVLCFQVMPNHIHLLLRLSDAFLPVETVLHTVSQDTVPPRRSRLSIVIAGMKRAITMFGKRNNIDFCWQSRFYDTIIRSTMQYSETNYYIQNNVMHWYEDKMNPDQP